MFLDLTIIFLHYVSASYLRESKICCCAYSILLVMKWKYCIKSNGFGNIRLILFYVFTLNPQKRTLKCVKIQNTKNKTSFAIYISIFRLLIGSADTCCLDYYKDDTFCRGKSTKE